MKDGLLQLINIVARLILLRLFSVSNIVHLQVLLLLEVGTCTSPLGPGALFYYAHRSVGGCNALFSFGVDLGFLLSM